MNSSPAIKTAILILCVLFILVLEVLIGFYVYTVIKTDFREEFVREVRRGVCKEEFKSLLGDKEYLKNICDVVGCKLLEPLDDKWHPMYPDGGLNRQKRYVPSNIPLTDPYPIVSSKTGPFLRVNQYMPVGPPCPPGPPGPPGATGPPGPIGLLGKDGEKGSPGVKGERGEKGESGSPGKDGHDGIPGLLGLTGYPGRDGVRGVPGMIGPPGDKGEKGDAGSIGFMGLQGEKGEVGPRGVEGRKGHEGSPGAAGPSGLNGKDDLRGVRGVKRGNTKSRLNDHRGKDGEKGSPGVKGERGEKGESGSPGKDGHDGIPGLPGLRGYPGRDGVRGVPGMIGPPGDKGEKGDARSIEFMGLQGEKGEVGPRGVEGKDGEKGSPGVKGERGEKGESGSPGKDGHDGIPGLPGLRGYPGRDGFIGVPGMIGPPGDKGEKGDAGSIEFMGLQGEKGEVGPRGVEGPKGDEGSPGPTGPSGLNGKDGLQGVQGLKGERGPPGQDGEEGLLGPRGLPGQCNSCETKHERRNESIIVKKFENKIFHSGFRINKSAECPSTSIVIGEREILGNIDEVYTSFMVDSKPPNKTEGYKYWATTNDNIKLFEFDDTELFIKNKPSTVYDLEVPFDGNAHVVYDGFFFYKVKGRKPKIMKYDFKNGKSQTLILPDLPQYEMKRLYLNNYNFFDFSVDQNGLWVILSISDQTVVAKINHESMIIECIWEISLKNNKVIDMFVASGTLYTLEFTPTFDVEIHLAINLDSNTVTQVNVGGIHQTGGITMATYDYRNYQLLLVDGDKRVAYLFLFLCEDDIVPTNVGAQ